MNNRIGVELVVDYDTCKARIPLERRITYLRGDSGEGKTTVYELLAGYSPRENLSKMDKWIFDCFFDRLEH